MTGDHDERSPLLHNGDAGDGDSHDEHDDDPVCKLGEIESLSCTFSLLEVWKFPDFLDIEADPC